MILRSYFINDVEQFNNTFHDVVLNINYLLLGSWKTLATLYEKQVHIGALNAELFEAIQHASYLFVLRNTYTNLWAKAWIK